ncbi:MAG: helix-turn-helix domain-containing protein, partial [Kutzneria sp.]|nr:helix-turn-helix domain-containing protein [Kutzneria sp.]
MRPDPAGAREQLAQRLKALHAKTGRSLKELEPLVHASDSSLSRYLSGRTVPPWSVVEGLCRAAGEPAEPTRLAWALASRERRPGGAGGAGVDGEPAAGWRERHPRLFFAAVVAVTAAVAGSAGVFAGARLFPVTRTQQAVRTQDEVCRDWSWPSDAGQAALPPVHPLATDHSPTVELDRGPVDGRQQVWAKVTGASYGDRVWLDLTSNNGLTWSQCGPFPVTGTTGASRAHPMDPALRFRACADTPHHRPGAPANACT